VKVAGSELLRLEGIYSGYGQRDSVLRDISISFGKGEISGLLGQSGSGKTTLLRTIALKAEVRAGSIYWEGRQLNSERRDEYRKGVVYLPQSSLDSLDHTKSVGEQLSKVAKSRSRSMSREEANDILLSLRLEPDILSMKPQQLSDGMRHRIVMAMALLAGAKLIMMDEPTISLDPANMRAILQILRRVSRECEITVIMASGSPDVLFPVCDSIHVLSRGALVESGTPDRLLKHAAEKCTAQLLETVRLLKESQLHAGGVIPQSTDRICAGEVH